MIFLISSLIMVALIVLSYLLDRKYPSQRHFIIPVIFLLLISVAGTAFLLSPIKQQALSEEQRELILKQQPKFTDWYADYQRDIHHINQFTNSYQRITQNYIDQQISAREAMEELDALYSETNYFYKELDKWQPPNALTEENRQLAEDIIKTTKVYQYHINETVRQSIIILQSGIDKGLTHKDTSNNLIRIQALEYPILLDNDRYIYQLRENLYLPKKEQ